VFLEKQGGKMKKIFFTLLPVLLLLSLFSCQEETAGDDATAFDLRQIFSIRSDLLSDFHGKEMVIEAQVLLPPDYAKGNTYAICVFIHGFGEDMNSRSSEWNVILNGMQNNTYPKMIYVYPTAQFEWGHSEFADSANNGPWGRAFTEEFLPALEAQYAPATTSRCRFLTGHSSGGWSCLWLQVTYPHLFNGAWSVAPDPVDFRDFTGINIYTFKNAYYYDNGEEIMLTRNAQGEWITSIRQYVKNEQETNPIGGQFFSFNAVFSEQGNDGFPKCLFDWESGVIDKNVAGSWKKYDITRILKNNWATLGSQLAQKLHAYVGELDTFRLEGPLYLFQEEMAKLGSDAECIFVPERDHFNIYQPHETLWPDGLAARIHREMWNRFSSYSQ
jgi:hypothetical protein